MTLRLKEQEQAFVRGLRRLPATERNALFAYVGSTNVPTPVRTIKSRAEIKAGNGFPCTASTPCSRRDLKTAIRASEHVTTNADLQLRGHIAK